MVSAVDRLTGRTPLRNAGNYTTELLCGARGDIAIYRFAPPPAIGRAQRRILVLKLDHFGDFVIGLPALKRLRDLFAGDHITLVCGEWNTALARQAAIADEIRPYAFFPENGALWTGEPAESLTWFRALCRGHFDLALDLRADEDTRFLLQHIDAALRCGIGARNRQPFLDIVLPPEADVRESEVRSHVLPSERFQSRMPVRTPFYHETDLRLSNAHIVYGPYLSLPPGRFRAIFGLELSAPLGRLTRLRITLDVARIEHGDSVPVKALRWNGRERAAAEIVFDNPEPGTRYEFRIHARGRAPFTRLRFFGVHLAPVEGVEIARQKRAELHVGERLSLLVELIHQRFSPLYPKPVLAGALAAGPAADALAAAPKPELAGDIVIAPMSNSETRDWGLDRYARLVALLLDRTASRIVLLGTAGQRAAIGGIVAANGYERRIVNLAGLTDWGATAAILRSADLVICNNSGVAHLAAASGAPTLAIYSGTHQPQEWGPRAARADVPVEAVSAAVPCSPCGYEKLVMCPHQHLCMRLIEPEMIAARALALLGEKPGAAILRQAGAEGPATTAPPFKTSAIRARS